MTKTKLVTLLLEQSRYDQIISKCKKTNTTTSAYIRNLIENDMIRSDHIETPNIKNDMIISNTDPSDVWEKLSI